MQGSAGKPSLTPLRPTHVSKGWGATSKQSQLSWGLGSMLPCMTDLPLLGEAGTPKPETQAKRTPLTALPHAATTPLPQAEIVVKQEGTGNSQMSMTVGRPTLNAVVAQTVGEAQMRGSPQQGWRDRQKPHRVGKLSDLRLHLWDKKGLGEISLPDRLAGNTAPSLPCASPHPITTLLTWRKGTVNI